MSKQVNILLLIPNKNDATSFYRGYGPFAHLRRNHENINLISGEGVHISWALLSMIDVIFMQRPYSDQHKQIAYMAKENNVKVWVDYDDYLFEVPEDNPSHQLYDSDKIKQNIAEIVAVADIVTTSTPQLKVNLMKLNKNITVVPNALDEQRIINRRLADSDDYQRRDLIIWRGSDTHVRDIGEYTMQMIGNIRKSQFTWVFIGHNPWYITQHLSEQDRKKIVYCQPMDTIEYFKSIQKLQASSIQVPLHDSMFNKCKSNIAYLEGVFAGCVPIIPNWAEWKMPGALVYEDGKSYDSALRIIINKEINLEETNRIAWEYVKDKFLLGKVNEKRFEIIKSFRN